MAKNWVILRYDTNCEFQNSDYGYKKYKEIISYIDILTILSYPEGSYRYNGLLIPESFDFFEIKSIDKTIHNIIINTTIQ